MGQFTDAFSQAYNAPAPAALAPSASKHGSGASEVKIELDQAGIHEFLTTDPGIAADLTRRASAIAAAAGDGMEWRVYVGRDRLRADIWTETFAARLAESEDRTLTIALDAGRD